MAKLFDKRGDPDQMPRSAASDLGLHGLPITLLGVSRQKWVTLALNIVCVWYSKYFILYEFKKSSCKSLAKEMCTILVNRLEDQACPVNVWLGKLTVLDMIPLG